MKLITITMPESKEEIGRWLETNNITLRRDFVRAKYNVTARRQLRVEYGEKGSVCRESRTVLRVTVYGEELNDAISRACAEVSK